MSPDRHDRVSELYHAASAHPPEKRDAFLTEACGEDVALRAEVESLLRFEGAASPFLEKPAAAFATLRRCETVSSARTRSSRRSAPAAWARSIARATRKLGRDVAIKILPSHSPPIPSDVARFAREARLLATLNHPHIGTIYGLEESDGVTALVLELVEGPDAGRSPRARPAADCRGAHDCAPDRRRARRGARERHRSPRSEAGQHRPAKRRQRAGVPSGDVRVKVLDFGLAKTMTGGRSMT